VQTLRLDEVSIEDTDIRRVELNMSKASTWMAGHARSKALSYNLPEPEEILRDINSLREFAKECTTRRNTTKDRRKKQLQP